MGTEERAQSFSGEAGGLRKIIHIDMDAFYASVEQRDNPELRGKPVAVGGSRERGVVAAASYEARQFGVHSAMPSITAKRKCPDLIFVKPRFDAYKAISLQIREIFAPYTPVIEPLSLDEAYLDITENLKGISLATQIAEGIRARVRAETELTASAGVSYNKFLAKLASDHRKPDGLFVITPKMGPSFVETLPVRKFHGVGPATARKMSALGIEPSSISRARPWSSCSTVSGKRAPIIIGPRAASTSGPCAPIGYASRSAPRTHSPPIFSPTKPRGMRFETLPTRSGPIARAPAFAAALSPLRSNSPTFRS
jgi:DNA polymerase-4